MVAGSWGIERKEYKGCRAVGSQGLFSILNVVMKLKCIHLLKLKACALQKLMDLSYTSVMGGGMEPVVEPMFSRHPKGGKDQKVGML